MRARNRVSSGCRLRLGSGEHAGISLRALSIPLLLQEIELSSSGFGSSRRLILFTSLLNHHLLQPGCQLVSFASEITACRSNTIEMRLLLSRLSHHGVLSHVQPLSIGLGLSESLCYLRNSMLLLL